MLFFSQQIYREIRILFEFWDTYLHIYIYIESDAGVPDPSGDLGTRRLNAVVFGEIQSRLGA